METCLPSICVAVSSRSLESTSRRSFSRNQQLLLSSNPTSQHASQQLVIVPIAPMEWGTRATSEEYIIEGISGMHRSRCMERKWYSFARYSTPSIWGLLIQNGMQRSAMIVQPSNTMGIVLCSIFRMTAL